MIRAILSASESWGIGKNGDLLFHISTDMKFFRRTTEGGAVIMGRKTLDSFPGGKPLKNRLNIVLTRDNTFEREGAVIVHSPEEALKKARESELDIYIIGGAEIYALFLDLCDECLVTKVQADPPADAFFPDLAQRPEWELADEGEEMEENGLKFRFTVYRRRNLQWQK